MENTFINHSLVILLLPLAAFLIQIFIGKRLPRQGDWVSILAIVTTLVLSIHMFTSMILRYVAALGNEELLKTAANWKEEISFKWLDMGSFSIELGILLDNVTIIMLLVVTLISTCTHIFLSLIHI